MQGRREGRRVTRGTTRGTTRGMMRGATKRDDEEAREGERKGGGETRRRGSYGFLATFWSSVPAPPLRTDIAGQPSPWQLVALPPVTQESARLPIAPQRHRGPAPGYPAASCSVPTPLAATCSSGLGPMIGAQLELLRASILFRLRCG